MRVAVAGLGWWGKQIIRCLSQSPKFKVLYGVDPKPPDDAPDFVKQFGVAGESSLDAVLRARDVEGVILATPHKLHEEQILAAVAAGKNVFCEKPLTMTAAGAERAIAACEKAGRVLGVGHERRYEPGFEEIGRMIAANKLGKLMFMDANVSHDKFRELDTSNWRLDPEHAPAGMMTALGIHLTDLFVSYAGPAAEVRAQSARMIYKPPAEDFVTAHILFKSGMRANMTTLANVPYYGRFTVYGDQGWVELSMEANVDQGKPTTMTYSDGKERRITVFQDVDTVRMNFDAWADAVEGRGTYRFTGAQLIENIRIFEAIVETAKRGGETMKL